MEHITKEQFNNLNLAYRGGATVSSSPILRTINELAVDEGLIVKNEEYVRKTKFNAFVRQAFRKDRTEKEIIVRRLDDNSGWAVYRTK